MAYGVTPTGFNKRTLEDILAQYAADAKAEISTSADTSSSSPLGQIFGVVGKTCSEIWDLGPVVYRVVDPSAASDDALDAVSEITGTTRTPALRSYVVGTMGLNAGVSVPAGSIAQVLGNPNVRFSLVGPEPSPGAPVVPGPVVSVLAGNYVGRWECTVTGPVAANAGTLTVIVTPVTGWNSITNVADAVRGENKELDSALRARREDELAAEGSSPVDAVRAEILRLPGMQSVTVFENEDDVTDANGVPPHSLECLVYDGPSSAVPDNTIAQRIWDSKAGGIRTYGSTSGNATDAEGATRVMHFSRPTSKTVYFTISISVDASFGATGDADIKAALVAKGQPLRAGSDVILASFYGSIFGVTGVTNVSLFKAGFTVTPSGTTDLAIATREKADFDTSRIVIIHV